MNEEQVQLKMDRQQMAVVNQVFTRIMATLYSGVRRIPFDLDTDELRKTLLHHTQAGEEQVSENFVAVVEKLGEAYVLMVNGPWFAKVQADAEEAKKVTGE